MEVKGIFSALRTTVSGMSAQMKKMNVISENIANADKAPDANGNVYNRKVVIQDAQPSNTAKRFGDEMKLRLRRSNNSHINGGSNQGAFVGTKYQDNSTVEEIEGFKTIYDPGNPLADKNGYIKIPDVNLVEEMVDMVSASRNYEANVSVMTATKNMAKRAMEI